MEAYSIFKLLLLFLLFFNVHPSQICHYSCEGCAGQSYTLCFQCAQNNALYIVEDPNYAEDSFINSLQPSGVCDGKVPQQANAFGIIMLILCIIITIVVRTKQMIYLVSTLQNLCLLSFIEICWITPSGYLLQSLQYFIPFNIIISGTKTEDDYTMRQRQFYRLHEYYKCSEFLQNISFVGFLNLFLIIGLIIFAILIRRNKKQKQLQLKQQNQQLQKDKDSYNDIKSNKQLNQQKSTNKFDIIINLIQTLFYLFILETSLTIMVGLRFPPQIPISTILISILYCIMLLIFLIYSFFKPIWFFCNLQVQMISIWRKIGLPVIVIVPPQYHYLIIVFMLIFMIGEGVLESKSQDFKLLSRISLYKILQLLVIIMALAFYLTEMNVNLIASSEVIRVFFTIFILLFYICVFIELVFGVYQTYFSKNKVDNSQTGKDKHFNTTQQGLGQQKNVFHQQNTLGLIQEDPKLQIFDIEDNMEDLQRQRRQKQQRQQQQRRKRQQQRRRRQQQQRRRRQQQQQQRRRRERQQQERRRRQQQERKRQEERKRKKQKQQEQRRRKQQEQRLRKQQEQRLRKEKQEQQRRRKQRQEQERRRRQQQQQEERRRREEEQQERRRRKKKYQGQLDPQLRKRYGF